MMSMNIFPKKGVPSCGKGDKVLNLSQKFPNKLWVGTMIMDIFPKKGVPSSGRGGWVDTTWDKFLNSNVFPPFLRASLPHVRDNISKQILA